MQALELDRRNVDAWVARGAAYANQHAFPKAISDFQTALGMLFSLLATNTCCTRHSNVVGIYKACIQFVASTLTLQRSCKGASSA